MIFSIASQAVSRFPQGEAVFSRPVVFSLTRWLLALLLFACIFIPRWPVGTLASVYSVDLRGEDPFAFLLILLVLGMTLWRVSLPEISSVEKAWVGFLVSAEVSILSGLWLRTIDKPAMSLLYLAKWIEYFLIFICTVRLTANRQDEKFFLKAFFFLGLAVAVFGYWEYFSPAAKAVYPDYYRLFERPPFHGDANHIGGFLVLWIGFFTGLFLAEKNRLRAGALFISILFVFFPLIWTYSRKSYFALAGALLFALLFSPERKKVLLLACLFVILGLGLPTRLSERILDLGEAFTSTDSYHSSWAGNLAMWKESLWNFEKFFLIGSGWGSRHRLFYESQYVLILAETGLIGFILFFRLVVSLISNTYSSLRGAPEGGDAGRSSGGWPLGHPAPSGWLGEAISDQRLLRPRLERRLAMTKLAWGWMIAFVGFLIHSASCVSWTVAKTAIPFWFLTAVVLARLKRPAPPS